MSLFMRNLLRKKVDFSESPGQRLMPKILTVRDLTFFGIAAIIGGGIFSSVGKACATGGPAVIWLFVICAIACGFAALCYAEFASRIPVSGSAYTYAYASFGELFAWIIGWALIMEYAIGNIYIAFSWSGYFVHLLDSMNVHLPRWLVIDYSTAHRVFLDVYEAKPKNITSDVNEALIAWNSAPKLMGLRVIFDAPAILINILITLLVYRGISESKKASNGMVIIKLVIIVTIILVGVFYIDIENYKPFAPHGMKGIMEGVAAVFFTFIGFDAISTLAEESKNPKRDLPLGMFYSLLICTVLYILISLVLTGMVPFNLLNVDDPLAFALSYKNIKWLEYIVSVSAIIAMASVLLVFQMGQPRIWMSMSRDGLLPPIFSSIHPKFRTPGFATIITGLVVGLPIFFTDENFVLDFTSIGTIFAFILVCGGVLLLPKREVKENDGFRLWYINGKYIYFILLISSILIVNETVPGYFVNEIMNFSNYTMFKVSHQILWMLFLIMSIFAFLRNFNLIPLLGVSICLYLLTGMKAENWKWFGIWFAIGLVIYFFYGYRKSKLK